MTDSQRNDSWIHVVANNRERWIDLRCHPSARIPAVHAVRARVRRAADGELRLTYRLDGATARLVLPAPAPPRLAPELWRHTCFEAFIAMEGQAAYHEFNFAPSGEWTVYAFRAYRDGGMLADEAMNPGIAVRLNERRLELDARVRLDLLSAAHPHASLRLGLAAIIEAADGFSYWALNHPPGRTDFHKAGGMALRLAARG